MSSQTNPKLERTSHHKKDSSPNFSINHSQKLNSIKSKKAEIGKQLLETILAIAGVILLLGASYLGYKALTTDQDSETAKNSVSVIEGKINALENNQETTALVRGVENWFIASWSKSNPDRPDKCFFNSCVCICPVGQNIKTQCQEKGFCRFFDSEEIITKDYLGYSQIGNNPVKEDIITGRIDLQNELTEFTLSKKENQIILEVFRQDYIDKRVSKTPDINIK